MDEISNQLNTVSSDLNLPKSTFMLLCEAHNASSWFDFLHLTINIIVGIAVFFVKSVNNHFPLCVEVEMILDDIHERKTLIVSNELTNQFIN